MKFTLTFDASQVFRAFKNMKAQAIGAHERCLKRAAVVTVERDAKRVWPSGHPGTPVDTGTLRRSIHTETVKRTMKEVRVQTGTNIEYAFFVHQGHRTRGGGRFIEGKPYLFGALETQFEKLCEVYGKCMKEAMGL